VNVSKLKLRSEKFAAAAAAADDDDNNNNNDNTVHAQNIVAHQMDSMACHAFCWVCTFCVNFVRRRCIV